jgi:hypothetical protein
MPSISKRRGTRTVEAAAAAGIVFAVLNIIALQLLTVLPSERLTDAEITEWYDTTGRAATVILGLNLATISIIAFYWFVAVIRRRIGDREDRFFATVFQGAAALYSAIFLAGAAIMAAPSVALVLLQRGSLTAGDITLASGLAGSLLLVVAPRIQAVFLFTMSTLVVRTEALPRWLAVAGYAVGLVLLLVPLVTSPLGIGFPVWIFVISTTILVLSYRHRGENAGAD